MALNKLNLSVISIKSGFMVYVVRPVSKIILGKDC